MSVSVGEAVGYLDLDISGFINNLKKANQEAESSAKTLSNTMGDGLQTVGGKISSVGKAMTAGITTPIVAAGTASVKTAMNFDSAMSKVSAISGATGKDFTNLKDKALEMGAKTKFSASEAADAMSYMAMAGWKTNDMLSGIEGIMDLAAASGEDLATTSDIVTDALTAFGMSASDSGHFADILAAASANANTNVSMLGESFKYVAPVAGALGYSAEDVSIALGLMANSGIKASQGGTALRTILTNMVQPTDEMAIAMEKLGVKLDDGNGNMLSFRDVMLQLREGFGNTKISSEELTSGLSRLEEQFSAGEITEKQYNEGVEDLMTSAYGAEGALKAQLAATLAGKTGMSGLLAIVNASDEDFNKLTNAIDNSEGAAKKMAETMQDNLAGRITKLKSALEGVAYTIGSILIPYVEKVVAKIQELANWFANLSEEQQRNIVKWAAIIAAVGPVILAIGKLIVGVGSLIKAFSEIKTAITAIQAGFGIMKGSITALLSGITAPMIAIAAIVAVLVAAFVNLWNTNEEFRNAMLEIWEGIKETISNFVSEISSRFSEFGITFESVISTISAIWNGFCELLAPIFIAAFEIASAFLQGILGVIVGLLDAFIGLFTGNWSQFLSGIKAVWDSIWNAIKSVIMSIVNAILSVVNTFLSWFGTNWNQVWNMAKTIVSQALNAVKSTVSNVINAVKSTISNGLNAAKNIVNNVLNAIKSKFTSIMEGCRSAVTNAIDRIKRAFNFSWSLPHLALPHLSISGSFSINPPSVPHFGISWYKKAMEGGMILKRPTIFGFDSKSGKFLGAGEAGPEAIVGVESLVSMIKQVVSKVVDDVSVMMASYAASMVDAFILAVNSVGDAYNKGQMEIISKVTNQGNINYKAMAEYLADILKDNPIINNFDVVMEDGNVYLDNERVGRKLAPVVSRIQAQM